VRTRITSIYSGRSYRRRVLPPASERKRTSSVLLTEVPTALAELLIGQGTADSIISLAGFARISAALRAGQGAFCTFTGSRSCCNQSAGNGSRHRLRLTLWQSSEQFLAGGRTSRVLEDVVSNRGGSPVGPRGVLLAQDQEQDAAANRERCRLWRATCRVPGQWPRTGRSVRSCAASTLWQTMPYPGRGVGYGCREFRHPRLFL
jgi:hypothetical protein